MDIGGQYSKSFGSKRGTLPPLEHRPGQENILNDIIPPIEWVENGKHYVRYADTKQASRVDVARLREQLDQKLMERQARDSGICPVREELFSQCFDEIIRQVTLAEPVRGQLLLRVRDEIRMTITAYQTLVPGASWNGAAGNLIMFFLEPAIISFSFGLFARKQLLWENAAAILGGAFCAAFAGILTLAWSARVVGVPHSLSLALMPRATAALAVVQAEMIGASAALTTVHCCLIGVFGANFGGSIMDALGLTSPISRGVAQGGAGLAVGSAALAQNDPSAFPFGTLTMSLASTIATLLFSMPSFQHLVFWVAGISR